MAETITNVSVGIVTGERTKINSATIKNGRIYFSKDTGELFYDWNDQRVQVCPQTTPNNGTLTIKQNSSTLGTFTANQAGNTEVNITVPSLSDLDASFTATGNNAIVGIGQVDGKITTVKYGTFLTSHQSLADYATKTWVNSSIQALDASFTGAANKAICGIGEVDGKITTVKYIDVPDITGLDASFTAGTNQAIVGIGQVDGKITTAKYGTFLTSHQSLADYATKTWVNSSIQALDASFTAGTNQAIVGIGQVDGKITTAKYGTFLTSHQSLADYATKTWVNSSIQALDSSFTAADSKAISGIGQVDGKITTVKYIDIPSLSNLDASFTATGNNAIVGIGQVDGKITTVKYDTFAKQSDIPDMPDLTNYVTTTQYNANMPNNFSGVYVWPTASSAANASIAVSPDSSKDILTFKAGTNVTLTGDTTNDIITINATNTTYSAGDGININTNNQISSATNIKVKVGDSSFLVPTGGSNPGILDISAGPNVTITPDVNAKRITVAASGFVQGDGISIIKAMTQSAYEALATKDPSTVYIVTADLD